VLQAYILRAVPKDNVPEKIVKIPLSVHYRPVFGEIVPTLLSRDQLYIG